MSIDIQPSELSFRRPFTVEVEQVLTIKNNGSTPLAFKVKTTAPKQYCVRPNAGRIEPGQDFDVTVILQAMKADPPLDSRCRDKFLVQSAPISADKDFSNIASILDSTDKSILQERKIRVNWLAAQGSDYDSAAVPSVASLTPSKHAINGASDTPDASRTFSSPAADAGPPPYSDEPSTHETPRSAVASGTSLFQTESKGSKVDADLSSAKDTGLRRRDVKTSAPSEKASRGQVAQAVKGPEGVPVQVVAMLCLLSFLLAYFFF